MRIKVNAKKCSGCRLCRQICAIHHFEEINPRKAALRIKAKFPSPGKFIPYVCTQCGKCAEACPEGAIYEKDGVYLIDEEKCTNCLLCVEACPFGVMFVHDDVDVPIKCDYCWKCTEVCNTGAIEKAA